MQKKVSHPNEIQNTNEDNFIRSLRMYVRVVNAYIHSRGLNIYMYYLRNTFVRNSLSFEAYAWIPLSVRSFVVRRLRFDYYSFAHIHAWATDNNTQVTLTCIQPLIQWTNNNKYIFPSFVPSKRTKVPSYLITNQGIKIFPSLFVLDCLIYHVINNKQAKGE